jgi:hypothetical protein
MTAADVGRFRAGATHLVDWLASEYDDSGASRSAPDNVQFYYKLPAVMFLAGRHGLALRLLDQAEARFYRAGHFDIESDPVAAPWAGYLGGWLSWGAAQLGRFDLARNTIESFAHLQNKQYGGFTHGGGNEILQDTERTSAAAMGCVWAGRIEQASSAARFLEYALQTQPAPDREFCAYVDIEGKVRPDYSDRNAYYRFDDDQARPALFATTVAFLVWLGRSTGREDMYDLAARYMKVVMSNRCNPARLPLATKTGWSAMLLARHRSFPELMEFAFDNGQAILERQLPDGSISFDSVADIPKPVDRVWLNGWGCDAALTLLALSEGV